MKKMSWKEIQNKVENENWVVEEVSEEDVVKVSHMAVVIQKKHNWNVIQPIIEEIQVI